MFEDGEYNLRVHHSAKVREWVASRKERIEMFFPPSYAPHLNPDEYQGADLKARISADAPITRKGQIKHKVRSHMRSL